MAAGSWNLYQSSAMDSESLVEASNHAEDGTAAVVEDIPSIDESGEGTLGAPIRSWGVTVLFWINFTRNIVAYFLMGLINNFAYVVMLSAALDMFEESGVHVPAGVVLLFDIVPALCVKLSAPLFIEYIPYWLRVLVVCITSTASFLLVALTPWVPVKLLGVSFASFSAGLGEVTFLALSSRYDKNVISSWSSGTGGAGLAGSFVYLALTTWLGLSNFLTLLLLSPLSLIIVFSYFLLLSKGKNAQEIKAEQEHLAESGLEVVLVSVAIQCENQENNNDNNNSNDGDGLLESIPIDTSQSVMEGKDVNVEMHADEAMTVGETSAAVMETGAPLLIEDGDGSILQGKLKGLSQLDNVVTIPLTVKLKLIWPLFWRYMLPLALVYWAEYTINQGVTPVLTFDEDGYERQELYRYYQFLYQLGVFVSRSSVNVVPLKNVILPAILQCGNLIFFIAEAMIRFLPSVYIVFFLIFWEGLLGGATYVNAFFLVTQKAQPQFREFSLSFVTMADSLGILLAALCSIVLEEFLRSYQGD